MIQRFAMHHRRSACATGWTLLRFDERSRYLNVQRFTAFIRAELIRRRRIAPFA
jgi:hypothetical protein